MYDKDPLWPPYYGWKHDKAIPLPWVVKWSVGNVDPIRAAWKQSHDPIPMLWALLPLSDDLLRRIATSYHRGAENTIRDVMKASVTHPTLFDHEEDIYWQIDDGLYSGDPNESSGDINRAKRMVRTLLKTVRQHEIPTIKVLMQRLRSK